MFLVTGVIKVHRSERVHRVGVCAGRERQRSVSNEEKEIKKKNENYKLVYHV